MKLGRDPTPTYRQALQDEPIIKGDIDSAAGTSGQEGAGKTTIVPRAREDQGVLGTDDGLIPNEAVTHTDDSGYLEGTDEHTLTGNLDDDIEAELAESSTAYPSIAGAKGEARDALDPDTPLTTEYPNNTPRLRDTPI